MKSNQTESPKYFFNIHHRNINVLINQDGTFEPATSYTGHLYLTLHADDQVDYFGKYPPEDNLLYGEGVIKTKKEGEKHGVITNLPNQTSNPHVFTKQIIITKEEYEQGIKYAKEIATGKIEGNKYIIGFADCVDFVQSVYNAAGLPLHFTTAYNKQELANLDTLASSKMLFKYGSRDTIKDHLSITEGVSREQLAKSLNISIDKIRPSSPVIDLSLQSYDSLLPKFKITIDDSDILPLDKIRAGIVRESEIGLSQAEKLERKNAALQLSEEERIAKIEFLSERIKLFSDRHIQKLDNLSEKFISELAIKSHVRKIIDANIEGFNKNMQEHLVKAKEAIKNGEAVDIDKFILNLSLRHAGHADSLEHKLLSLNNKLVSDTQTLQEMLMMLVLKEKNKQLENQNKYNKLVEKVKASLEEYEDKANNIFKNFVEAKADSLRKNGENLNNQANAEIQQIAASIETKNAALHAQKQAELDMIPPVRIQTGPNSYLDTNEAARNQKQAEYESLLAQYKSQCESQIANIKAKYESQANQQKQSVESDISNKASAFKEQKETYAKEVLSKLDEIKAKLSKGEDVDIDNIINEIDISTSVSLSNIQHSVNQGNTVVYALSDIIYDNPILNHPELIKHMAAKFGSGIIDKLISFGMQFTSSEDKSLLDNICNEPNSLDNVSLLMGLDTVDSITYN